MWYNNFMFPRKRFWTCIILVLGALAAIITIVAQGKQPAKPDNPEHAGVVFAIEHYFKGHATGDASHMRKAFLPTAHIEGIREGKFTSWTLDRYCENFKGTPAADESTRKRNIDSIDVIGTAAMVKATLVHGRTTFTDYFVLLKVDGEWKIANKVYHGQRQ
jgi:Putative lumazine-binding